MKENKGRIEEVLEYDGKRYIRRNSHWLDRDNFAVPQYMQNILNTLFMQKSSVSEMSVCNALENGDKAKTAESYLSAIKYYETALDKANMHDVSYILPRISSCYRKLGKPAKCVELLEKARTTWGDDCLSTAFLTSVAAALCDLESAEEAMKTCKWAYSIKKDTDTAGELSSVFARVRDMLDIEYDD